MKYRYIVVDDDENCVVTNDKEQAEFYADSIGRFVFDTETNELLNSGGTRSKLEEAPRIDESGCEEELEEDGDADE